MPEKTTPTTSAPKTLQTTREETRHLRPPVDIYEVDGGLRLLADLPGVLPADLSVRVEDGVLTVSAVAKLEQTGESLHEEFALTRYFRQFEITDAVDAESIEASLRHGVLTLTLPHSTRRKPREVKVQLG